MRYHAKLPGSNSVLQKQRTGSFANWVVVIVVSHAVTGNVDSHDSPLDAA